MANDLATTTSDPATAFSTLVWSPNTQAVLERAFDHSATFTAEDMALAERIAAGTPIEQPASEDYIRRSMGSLAGAMPAQSSSNESGKLKLATYQTMLAGCDERALAYACRRCLDELDWMPTVHQIKSRMADWVNPEQAAIARAKVIVRTGRRAIEGDDGAVVDAGEMRRLRQRVETAATSLAKRRVEPVAFSTPGDLEPHQLRIPNKDDYQRLFGIDPETERLKAEAAQRAAEEADADLLRAAVDLHNELHRAA